MKKIVFTAIVLFLVNLKTFAQEYYPMLNNSTWLLYDFVSCCQAPEERFVLPGSTQVFGIYSYSKFIDPFAVGGDTVVYLREEVNTRKLYKRINEQDVLLYDFNLRDADTITLPHYFVSASGPVFDQLILYTATVDSVVVTDGFRKRITLKSNELFCGNQLRQVWIEGVGSEAHPFYPDFNMFNVCAGGGGYNIYTKCSFQNGVYLYGDSSCAALSVVENVSENDIILFPNPSNDLVHVRLQMEGAAVTVFDVLGKEIYSLASKNTKQTTFSVASLARGLYIVRIATPNNTVITKKLMVE